MCGCFSMVCFDVCATIDRCGACDVFVTYCVVLVCDECSVLVHECLYVTCLFCMTLRSSSIACC